MTGYADGACKTSVSGSTPDIASRRSSLFERPPGNVYDLPDDAAGWLSITDDYDASDPNTWAAPYCPTCDRFLCRARPMHDVIYAGDPRHPKYRPDSV